MKNDRRVAASRKLPSHKACFAYFFHSSYGFNELLCSQMEWVNREDMKWNIFFVYADQKCCWDITKLTPRRRSHNSFNSRAKKKVKMSSTELQAYITHLVRKVEHGIKSFRSFIKNYGHNFSWLVCLYAPCHGERELRENIK